MLSIATINIQNKYQKKHYNGVLQTVDHTKILLSLIKKYNLDIVGLQEVSTRYYQHLKEQLKMPYQMVGQGRYPRNVLFNHLYPFSVFNESVNIISKQKIMKSKTIHLPLLPSFVPRIMTVALIKTEEFGTIVFINTHLNQDNQETKERQLTYLLNYIKKLARPFLLVGDFNMTIRNTALQAFIKSLKEQGATHINPHQRTYKGSKVNEALDHIFISSEFVLKKIIIEKRIEEETVAFSDHYPVIVQLEKRLTFK